MLNIASNTRKFFILAIKDNLSANIQFCLNVDRDRYNVYMCGISMFMIFHLVDIYFVKTIFSNYIDE